MHRIPLEILDWKTDGAVDVNGVAWGGVSALHSVGHTAYNQEVFYFGAMALMPPEEFLRLAWDLESPHPDSLAYQRESFRDGHPVAPPFLKVRRLEDGHIAVEGHEGRHRAKALMMERPGALLPVALIGAGEFRARHIGPEEFGAWATSSVFLDQDGFEAGPVDFQVIYHAHSGVVWTHPALNYTPHIARPSPMPVP